jgi:hypothetical protein
MATPPFFRDPCLDALLDLDGEVFILEGKGRYWVKFEVKRVEASPERPHGLGYSLTLHDDAGDRLVGFDNAHAVGRERARAPASRRPMTTGIGFGPCVRTTTRMAAICWRISGGKLRGCSPSEE